MASLKKNELIELEYGGTAKVLDNEPLGSGGQGEVYRVEYKGKNYALKWYTSERILNKNKEEFRRNILENIRSGSPNEDFLWPQYLTNEKDGRFGYLMDLIPNSMEPFSNILRTYKLDKSNPKKAVRIPIKFTSMDAIIKSSIRIVMAFRELHRAGKSYQDLNDGGIFFDVKTGDILVCDCDNVAPFDSNYGIGGKPGYMAPEVVTRRAKPNMNTDKFSLAVILFRLFMRGDPLEGARVLSSCSLTGEAELKHYGTDPLFVYDPKDDSNRPVRGVHNNVIKLWDYYPQYLRDAFITSFTDGMHDPNARLIENDWFKLLSKLRSDIVMCPCGSPPAFGSDNIVDDRYTCSDCGNEYPVFKIGNQKIVANENMVLYANQTEKYSEDIMTVTGKIVENSIHKGIFGMKNLSDITWVITYKDGTQKNVQKGGGAPLQPGMEVNFSNGIIGKLGE